MLWKKRRKRKKKAWINAEWPSIGWLRESNVLLEIPHSENADVEFYTTYPKIQEKRTGTPSFLLRLRTPKGTTSGSCHFQTKHPEKTAGNPVAHSRTQGNPFEVTCTNILYYYYIKKNSAGKIRACARDHSRDCRSGPLLVMSLTVAPPRKCDFVATYILLTSLGLLFSDWDGYSHFRVKKR